VAALATCDLAVCRRGHGLTAGVTVVGLGWDGARQTEPAESTFAMSMASCYLRG